MKLVQHVSTPDGPTVGWAVHLDKKRRVWCGEISRDQFSKLDGDLRAEFETDFGWFLILFDSNRPMGNQAYVLTKAPNEYAARELALVVAEGWKAGAKLDWPTADDTVKAA